MELYGCFVTFFVFLYCCIRVLLYFNVVVYCCIVGIVGNVGIVGIVGIVSIVVVLNCCTVVLLYCYIVV